MRSRRRSSTSQRPKTGAQVLDELYEIDGLVPVPAGSYDVIRDLETELADLLG